MSLPPTVLVSFKRIMAVRIVLTLIVFTLTPIFRPQFFISYAVWLYYRFNLSHRDVEDLLAERGITVSYETIRLWCIKFGPKYSRRLKRKHQGFGDTFYIDEVFVKLNGKQHYLWRAVDQDGEVVDVFLQARRDGNAAKRFFRRLLRSHDGEPRKIVTDKLRSYGVAHREIIPKLSTTRHNTRIIEPSNRMNSFYSDPNFWGGAANIRGVHSRKRPDAAIQALCLLPFSNSFYSDPNFSQFLL